MKHAKKKQNTKYTQWNQMSAIICYKSVVLCGFPRRSHSPAHGLSLQTPSCDSFVLQQLLGFVRPSVSWVRQSRLSNIPVLERYLGFNTGL